MMRLATALLAAFVGSAGAQELSPSSAGQHYDANAIPDSHLAQSRRDRARFHRSGTRGRQGLGASPLHPEGPGNTTR